MPKRRWVYDPFDCPKAKRWVSITGYDLELDADGWVADVASGPRTCSGTPGCGTTLGADNCPYKTNRNTGR
jgi:hypothetical protein